ncbi:MAG TPA: 5-amino-6-(D-ribitylamino)uracil--L-tyrosine 4-hydroxyphenyl transferase CofH [Acidimicrobiia bacterium]|nr:5-amino-6-(D-ribitylamino)uracil--L-tyrosine 4-hydroxyphenyl transferase CofH [Acidimicrobiia bacterium]
MITYCRLRPARAPGPAWAATCRREGTTTVELPAPGPAEVAAVLAAGLLPVAGASSSAGAAAWVVGPDEAEALAAAGIPGWRITLADGGDPRRVAEALHRCRAAYLRTGRSRVGGAASVARRAGAVASVFVDTVGDARAAVEAGAGDLLLRDWDTERLGELRDALEGRLLVERTAFPPGLPDDEASGRLDAPLLKAYLGLVDATGAARPRHDWAPGRDLPIPPAAGRLSAQWADPAWTARGRKPGNTRPALSAVLARSLGGRRPGPAEIEALLHARGDEVEAVAAVADELRRRAVGDRVTYVVNRNVNYTNRCVHRCGFCAFSRGARDDPGREAPFLLEVDEIARRAAEAWGQGATEVCLQGGIHPAFTGDFYLEVVRAVKAAAPGIHVHAFSPLEVWQGAESLGVPVGDFLRRLKDTGLGSLPGTAAEVLDDGVRRVLCPDKIDSARWAEVVVAAHRLGIPTTATIMFGHVDSPASWARHLVVVRRIQEETGGFTEFVPLPFVHMEAPIYRQGRARPGPTWDEVVLVHAVARLAFDGLIPNLQASWVKLGLAGAAALLRAGVNDLGGTLTDEGISRAAGAAHGSGVTSEALERVIRAAERVPAERTTLYELPTGVTRRHHG